MDGNGNAVAAWMQTDSVRVRIWARRFIKNTGWEPPILLDNDVLDNLRFDQLAVDTAGNATLVGNQQIADGSSRVWVKRFRPATGWAATEYSEYLAGGHFVRENGGNQPPDANGYRYATSAIDGSGNAFVVWPRAIAANNNRLSLWGARYTPSNGWATATTVSTPGPWDAANPSIAVDARGNAVVAWESRTTSANGIGLDRSLLVNRFAITPVVTATVPTWDTTTFTTGLDSQGLVSDVARPQISFDASGNTAVTWKVGPPTNTVNSTYRYTAGTPWQTSSFLRDDTAADARSRGVTVQDAAGNLLAVYPLLDPFSTSTRFREGRYNLVAQRFVAATGWGPVQRIESDVGGDSVLSGVGIDAAGHAVAVWTQQFYNAQGAVTTARVWANRFQPTTGWAMANRLDTSAAAGVLGLSLASFDTNGNATVLWQQTLSGSRTGVWATSYR